jgi:NADH-quinone oxidoreductase subunit F
MDFKEVRAKAESAFREKDDKDAIKIHVSYLSGNGTAEAVLNRFKDEVDRQNIKGNVIATGSFGYYALEPMVLIEKLGQSSVLYHNVTVDMVSGIVSDYTGNAGPGPDIALRSTAGSPVAGIPDMSELPLFNLQKRVALRNCGYTDPADINHYIVYGKGYSGLSKALQLEPLEVIEKLKKSGLRGKGGAGYSTAEKWQICHDAVHVEKYVICNAVDADPLAFTARLLLESDPHSVLEGMLIAAYAVGASRCIVYMNAEYEAARKRLLTAVEQMKEYNLTGNAVLDATFNVEIEIKEVPVSLVSGEETALLRTLEGRQVMPYIRPPYPAASGLEGRPSLINNVETLACVSAIFQNSPDWYSSCGTERSKGTKVFSLSGSLRNKYTVEVPFGTTLQSIVEDIGGGVPDGKKIKAVQFGGPTGAFFDAGSLEIPVDYEAVENAGSIIGSGTIEVFDSGSCAVGLAHEKIAYLHAQSCGKCVFCREGTYQMSDMLEDITGHRGKNEYIDLITGLGEAMKLGCICGLGRNASNPVISSIGLFRHEYDVHINEKRCPVKDDT